MKRNKQARIVLKVMAVLIACLTLNATAKEVPAQLPAAATGNATEVWHDKVPEPVHVRFAWHRNPLHNLYNMEKLPAPPFRTDKIDLSPVAKGKRR